MRRLWAVFLLAMIRTGKYRVFLMSLRNRRWRLVENPDGIQPTDPPDGDYPIPAAALFDLRSDPLERVDVSAENADLVRRMRRALRLSTVRRADAVLRCVSGVVVGICGAPEQEQDEYSVSGTGRGRTGVLPSTHAGGPRPDH